MKIIVAAVVAVIVIAAVGAAGAYFFLVVNLSQPSEQTAKWLPEDTAVYFSLNLRPGADQLLKLRKILTTFEDNPDYLDMVDDAFDFVEDETDIDLEKDVLTWAGPEISFAVLDFEDFEDPEVVVFVGTTNKLATEDLVDALIDYMEDSEGYDVDRDSVNGFEAYIVEDRFGDVQGGFAITDDFLVMATSQRTLKRTIDRMQNPTESLSDNPKFIQAQSMALDSRVALLYVNVDSATKDIESVLDSDELEIYEDSLEELLPEVYIASLMFIDMGVVLRFSITTPNNDFAFGSSNPLKAVHYMPEDTLAFFSGVGIPQIWEEMMDRLTRDIDREFGVSDIIDEFEDEFDLDLERDIVEWMTGEYTVALINADISIDRFDELDDAEVEVIGLIEFENRIDVDDALENIVDALESQGLDIDEEQIDGETAVLVDLRDDYGIKDYDPGFVINENLVIVGATFESLENAIDIRKSGTNSLANSPKYQRVISAVDGSIDFVLYVSAQDVIETVTDSIGPSGRAEYREKVAPFVESIEAILIGIDYELDQTSWSIVLTLEE